MQTVRPQMATQAKRSENMSQMQKRQLRQTTPKGKGTVKQHELITGNHRRIIDEYPGLAQDESKQIMVYKSKAKPR